MRYASIDTTQEGRKEYGHGFCNAKKAIAFKTASDRKAYLEQSYDMSAREITRSQAEKMIRRSWHTPDKGYIEVYTATGRSEDTRQLAYYMYA